MVRKSQDEGSGPARRSTRGKTSKSATLESVRSVQVGRIGRPAEPPTPSSGQMPDIQVTLTHDQIARKAYDIWLAKGRPQGSEQTNWFEAIQSLRQDAAVAAHSPD